MGFTVVKAKRKAVPVIMSVSGTSGSGKTYTALLLAAGIAGPNGKVGMIDTENGRGAMYADSPGIMKALPDGYLITQMDPPFGPERYVEALKTMELNGVTVCVVDSGSHEWEGEGGCSDIAENNKLRGMPNWAKAKLAHKRFVNYCLSSPMSIVFCLRAREKVKIVKDANGKEQFVNIGLQSICEKSFVYEMLVSVLLDEATHHAIPLKVPEPLVGIITGGRMLTKADGDAILKWNQGGAPLGQWEQLEKRAATAAERGSTEYKKFFEEIAAAERKRLQSSGLHEKLKTAAVAADAAAIATESEDSLGDPIQMQREAIRKKLAAAQQVDSLPDAFDYNIGDILAMKERDGSRSYWTPNRERSAWERYIVPEENKAA